MNVMKKSYFCGSYIYWDNTSILALAAPFAVQITLPDKLELKINRIALYLIYLLYHLNF
jgi:hypothetical protein